MTFVMKFVVFVIVDLAVSSNYKSIYIFWNKNFEKKKAFS